VRLQCEQTVCRLTSCTSVQLQVQSLELKAGRALDRIGPARHGSSRLGSGERPCTDSEPIGVRNQLLQKKKQNPSLGSRYWPYARFGTSERFAVSSLPELFRYVPKGSVPSRSDAVRAFHLLPLSFISADCAVPSRADPTQCAPS
jgi:hypothetical protein